MSCVRYTHISQHIYKSERVRVELNGQSTWMFRETFYCFSHIWSGVRCIVTYQLMISVKLCKDLFARTRQFFQSRQSSRSNCCKFSFFRSFDLMYGKLCNKNNDYRWRDRFKLYFLLHSGNVAWWMIFSPVFSFERSLTRFFVTQFFFRKTSIDSIDSIAYEMRTKSTWS